MASAPAPRRRYPSRLAVLLLVPNLVTFARAAVVAAAWALHLRGGRVAAPAALHAFAAALDGLDGVLARRLGQASAFGAAADVVVDIASRGTLWAAALPVVGAAVPFVETLVFAATHASGGAAWKTGCFANAPRPVAAIMANGFKTPPGVLAVAGLHFLPLWLWLRSLDDPLASALAPPWAGGVLVLGRSTAAVAELWLLQRHAGALLDQDVAVR